MYTSLPRNVFYQLSRGTNRQVSWLLSGVFIAVTILAAVIGGGACSFDSTGIGPIHQDNNNNNNGSDQVCGNNVREGSEVCDGSDLGGETCVSQGFESGEPACLPDCSGFDTPNCVGTGPVCGDNVRESFEVCDGSDLGGETCVSQGFESGELDCLEDCSGFDTSACGMCGDGIINGDEECDGDNLGGLSTCADFGCRSDGTVTCNTDCTYNISACFAGHDEDGDGMDDNCDNCPSYYNPGQADSNNDGIGDVCEYPGNGALFSEIVVFDQFFEDEDSWTATNGIWNYGNGIVTGNRQDEGAYYLHDLEHAALPYAVETTFYYNQPPWLGKAYAGVIFARRLAFYYECTFERRNEELAVLYYKGLGNSILLEKSVVSTSADDSQWRKIHVFYDGADLICRYLDETGATLTIVVLKNELSGSMAGRAGLRVYNERAVFTSFVAYQ